MTSSSSSSTFRWPFSVLCLLLLLLLFCLAPVCDAARRRGFPAPPPPRPQRRDNLIFNSRVIHGGGRPFTVFNLLPRGMPIPPSGPSNRHNDVVDSLGKDSTAPLDGKLSAATLVFSFGEPFGSGHPSNSVSCLRFSGAANRTLALFYWPEAVSSSSDGWLALCMISRSWDPPGEFYVHRKAASACDWPDLQELDFCHEVQKATN